MITKLELIEYLKHTPENTNYNILYSSLYNGSNKEIVDEFIEVLSRGNLSLAALQPYLAKLYEDDKTISPDPLPPFSIGGSPDAVLYTPQTLTDAQKKQARQNIDAESYFVVNGTMTSNFKPKLDKTFSQIREAISDGKIPIVAMSGSYFQLSQNTDELITFLVSVADVNTSGFQTINVYPTAVPQIHFYSMLSTDIYGALPQVNMASGPTEAMQIATKKYVDDALAAIVDGTEVSY